MPPGVELARHTAQRVIEQLIAVAILAPGFIIDKAIVIGEVRPIVSNGQALVVVSGTKKIDITNEGFLNARKPEKLKEEMELLVKKIEALDENLNELEK